MKYPSSFDNDFNPELSMSLIQEEMLEVEEAFNGRDLVEMLDGLGDLMWVTVRAMYRLGVDPEKLMKIIYDSNMTKMCDTLEEVHETINFYKKRDNCECKVEKVEGKFLVKRAEDGKVLKNVNFRNPEKDIKKLIKGEL